MKVFLVLEKLLGQGSFGSVMLYKRTGPNFKTQYIAIKISKRSYNESFKREFRILSQFSECPGIVQCVGNALEKSLDRNGKKIYKMTMEYASGGNLRNLMDRHANSLIPEPMIRCFTGMILEGLATIHSHGYVHCDLKPENILVFPSKVKVKGVWRSWYNLKISDFGLAREVGDDSWHEFPDKIFAGTPAYMSPESVKYGMIMKGLDIWSLGCVVLEMYTGTRQWLRTVDELFNGFQPHVPKNLPCDASEFINKCFAFDLSDRGNALGLLEHRFLSGDVKMLEKKVVGVTFNHTREYHKDTKSCPCLEILPRQEI